MLQGGTIMEVFIELTKEWFLNHAIPIFLIIIIAWIARKVLNIAISRFEKRFEQKGIVSSEQEKRAKTLIGIVSTSISVVIYVTAIMMVITECGVNIGPLLAGAGIAGLAIGFGAQSLVKDVISGFFLLMEDQIRVGDVANIAGIGGLVEAINLRTTRLRDLEGRVHIIPNGSITVATNLTRDWSRALIEIGVAYKENVDNVIAVLEKVGEELRNDPAFKEVIIEPMTVLGLDSFGDSSVNIRLYFKTLPIKQWEVAREFRKRVKRAFDENGIEIPFPHRTIYMGEGENTGKLQVEASVNPQSKA
jgi:small conductance mechanosensitive channel